MIGLIIAILCGYRYIFSSFALTIDQAYIFFGVVILEILLEGFIWETIITRKK